MPIMVQNSFPWKKVMEENNVFVMDEKSASHQDIRPIEIAILNSSPFNKDMELALWRILSNTPLQINITSLICKSEKEDWNKENLNGFFKQFSAERKRFFDGLIVTGIPDGTEHFEEKGNWDELCEILDWSDSHVTSTLFLGEGAQMALYHFYGIDRVKLSEDFFGVYSHRVTERGSSLVRGFDDVFYSPHFRMYRMDEELIKNRTDLNVLAESDEAGTYLLLNPYGSRIFCLGHPELNRSFLDKEYRKRLDTDNPADVPKNYYLNDDVQKMPLLRWRGHGNALFSNWLNYYVYQNTPFEFNQIFLE